MNPDILLKWFWVPALVVTGINAAVYRYRANQDIREHPEKAEGYRRLIRGFVIWTGLPWVMLGALVLAGGVDTFIELFQTKRPAAIAWQVMIAGIYVLAMYWIFIAGGAEMLVRHPAMLGRGMNRVWVVKLFTLLMIAGGSVALFMIWTGKIPPGGVKR